MSEETNKQEFEKLSFWQLLAKTSIDIPIIQRDYAQGRKNQEKVREKFLTALYEAFTGHPVELDFVYGSEVNGTLQPLDGQQRLTTLFLLHWFIATKENKLDDTTMKVLSKFKYETRTSSREFCKELITQRVKIEDDKKVSASIKNTAWFVASWEKDTTISAMLIMLDAIQKKFTDTTNLWNKLTDEQNPTISFLYVKLENFGLSDDLYIKMNARGKQLTPFENFKSRFEKHIEKHEWEKSIQPEETFSHNIDTVWANLFWQYRGEDGLIDNKLINFIAGVAINYYAQSLEISENKEEAEMVRKDLSNKEKTNNVTDNAVQRERIERRIQELVKNSAEVIPEELPTKEAFEYLTDCLNKYAESGNSKIKSDVNLWDYCKTTLFEDFIQDTNVTYPKRVLFYAQTIYLLNNNPLQRDCFYDWMRVIRNIVHNSTIDSPTSFIAAIHLIHELSAGCANIYDFLSKNAVQAGHAQEQVKEEIEKAKIIEEKPNAKQVIHDTEDTNFCKGNIDFVLYCIDFDTNKLDTLKDIKDIIDKEMNPDNIITDDFKRAFLTIKDNDSCDFGQTWSLYFNCHKKWLWNTYKDIKNHFTQNNSWRKYRVYRDYLKELLIQHTKKSYKQIIADYNIPTNMPNWKKRLIKEDSLLDGATFILVPTDNSYCLLTWKQRPSRADQVKKIE
ncbi:MAG: hypothetical protein MdMp024_0265 [Bacteroidales bacterium]